MHESMSSLTSGPGGFGDWNRGTRGRGNDDDEDDGMGLSEQSTPVLMRSTKRFGVNREDAGTPSPGDRRNGN